MQARVMVARFPGKFCEHPASSNWAWETIIKAKADPRISHVYTFDKSDTPITMVRNDCVRQALELGVDVLVMVDNDMEPDAEPDGKPFWEEAFNFWWDRRQAPMVIGAPYVGPPPLNNIYVFQFENHNNYDEKAIHLPQFNRNEAARMSGITRVGALPTGCILYGNLPSLMKINPDDPGPGLPAVKDKGWFYYEWTDNTCSQKASTEDVTNTRDLALVMSQSGIPDAGVYCTWDSWASHIKPQPQRKPRPVAIEDIGDGFRKAVENGTSRGEKRVWIDRQFPKVEQQVNGTAPKQIRSAFDLGQPKRSANLQAFASVMMHSDADMEALSKLAKQAFTDWEKGHVSHFRPPVFQAVEVGSWIGDTAKVIAEAIHPHDVTCIDTWKGSPNDTTGRIVEAHGDPGALWHAFCENTCDIPRTMIRGRSTEVASTWDRGPIDFLFIDADHAYESTLADIDAWTKHVADNGTIVFHDYESSTFPGVTRAVKEAFGHHVTYVENSHIGYVFLTPDAMSEYKSRRESRLEAA